MNKQQLAAKIWESANRMRSKIEANEYKDYILGFIFYKYLSDKEEQWLLARGYDADSIKEYVNEEGRRGLKVWSESTGAEIFLPVTGYFEASVLESQTMGYYWTSALAGTDSEPSKAIALSFDTEGAVKDAILRFRGLPIRPVKAKP